MNEKLYSAPAPFAVHFNMRASAAEVYLVEQWQKHSGEPRERRDKIFAEFIALGLRKRWEYHRKAVNFQFNDDEKTILACRSWKERAVADWVGEDLKRVLFTTGQMTFTDDQLELMTGWGGENEKLVLQNIDALPERVYSMTAFDDPDDVEEVRSDDQSTHVSGVYWTATEQLKIIWVDEFGVSIREKVCDPDGLKEGAEAFERYRPFESSWWTEATRIGKYAAEN